MFADIRRLALITCAVALSFASSRPVRALDLHERYEERLIARALERTGLQRATDPGGKRIDRILSVRFDIIGPGDPWPRLLNAVHVTTKDGVVRQEMLIGVGDIYNAALVAESERNLRRLFILSVARVVVCRGTTPGTVTLLVVTKDLWSLRLNMIYAQTGALVTQLDFTPTEENLLGRNKRVSLHVALSQLELRAAVPFPLTLFTIGRELRDRLVLGQSYLDRRIWGSRLQLFEQLDVHVDGSVPCGGSIGTANDADPRAWCNPRGAGAISGVLARVRLERPLFSLATPWGFHVDGQIDTRPVRYYRQNADAAFDPNRNPGERPGVSLEAIAFTAHPDGVQRNVPHAYDRRRLIFSAGIVRSVGRSLRHDFTSAVLAYRLQYRPPEGFPFDPLTATWFEQSVLPRSESVAAVVLAYGIRPTRYVKVKNLRTFALSEDVALGPQLQLETRVARNLVEGRQSFLEAISSASYSWIVRNNLTIVYAAGTTRYQLGLTCTADSTGLEPDCPGPWVNNRAEISLYNAFPAIGPGRLHTYAALVLRRNDLDRGFSRLGGAGAGAGALGVSDNDDATLRGFPSGRYAGRNLLRLTAEYRTRAINLWTMHAGGVLFYDGGSAWGQPGPSRFDPPFRYRQSVGLGLRALFPQFDRETLRVDLGIPLQRNEAGAIDTWMTFSFGQAF